MASARKTSEQRLAWALETCRRLRLRLTPTRRAILGCLSERRTPATLEAIAAADGVRGGCDATTVYRTLTLFKEAELVRLVSSPRKQSCFLLNVPGEGGNLLVCRNCGETVELPLLPASAGDIRRLIAQQGFAPDQWDCVVHGLCQRCERELKSKVIPTKLIH
jgi:Fe2+ or Zn2+ uptake regulation protein